MNERRIALLVDGENLSVEHAGFLILAAAKSGVLSVKRVFGSVTRLGGWTTAPGFRVVHIPPKKDAADLALSLDALELALTRQVDEIFLATSDRDMTLVALRLMELGVSVTGIGEEKAPEEFRKSCRKFMEIKGKTALNDDATALPFDARMRSFFKSEGDADGWITLSSLGQQRAKALGISKAEAGIGKTGSWIGWFEKHPTIFESKGRGTEFRARLKPAKKA